MGGGNYGSQRDSRDAIRRKKKFPGFVYQVLSVSLCLSLSLFVSLSLFLSLFFLNTATKYQPLHTTHYTLHTTHYTTHYTLHFFKIHMWQSIRLIGLMIFHFLSWKCV